MALTVKLTKASQTAKGACEAFRVEDSNDNSTLEISLRRTVRVPDNGSCYSLPPDLGAFPIYNVLDYQARLPSSLVKKGVTFIPIYQREAMWINFKANGPFAIQIYVGGVNADSGEPKIESFSTLLRRKQLLSQGKSIQDYVTPPVQYWPDGIANQNGKVTQFVAAPVGSGYSVEAQITGSDSTAGVQFEIIPRKLVLVIDHGKEF